MPPSAVDATTFEPTDRDVQLCRRCLHMRDAHAPEGDCPTTGSLLRRLLRGKPPLR